MGGTLDILGVDSDTTYRDLYTGWLGADHNVTAVEDGQVALDEIDSECDLVLLGRDLPEMTGREAADALTNAVADCHVVMVGDAPADFDIIEYPIERYAKKPLDGPELDRIIDQYETQQSYQAALEEYFRLTSKLGAIEADLSEAELATSDRYDRVKERVEEQREKVDGAISESDTDWDFAFKTCAGPSDADAISQL